MSSEPIGYAANYQRGVLLRNQQRYREASDYLGRAIAADPEKAPAYVDLALCLNDWGAHERDALQAIDRAIALEPMSARFWGFKGWILVCQRKFSEALRISMRAVELDPMEETALNALTNSYTKLSNWPKAAETARRILALHPENIPAHNLLAQALRFQGYSQESREVVARTLALTPNNAFAQMNAGYTAMEAGDHVRAREHFLHSLRISPNSPNELAREGLLHSLRARIWVYRWQYQVRAFLRRPGRGRKIIRTFVIPFLVFPAVIFIGSLFLGLIYHCLGSVPVVLILGCGFLSLFAGPIGNLFLLLDPQARHALGRNEKNRANLFGCFLALGLWVALESSPWVFAGLVAYLGLFSLAIYYPQLRDVLAARRVYRPAAGS